ncbi:MAG: CHAT domain-containing protein [Burkholderiales bacterium]|nr:CHAT domain-containing protein [Burkholderiales bacterium]
MFRNLLCYVMLCCAMQAARADDKLEGSIDRGLQRCQGGHYFLALEDLTAAYNRAQLGAQRAKAAGALGLTYAQMRIPSKAEPLLREAYAYAQDVKERAQFGIDLANLLASRGKADEASHIYQDVRKLAPKDVAVAMSVGLNLARLDADKKPLPELNNLYARLAEIKDSKDRARFSINLGALAKAMGPQGIELAYQSFEGGRKLAQEAGDSRLSAEAFDQLSQLYEEQNRGEDALRLSEQGILILQTIDARDLLLKLEWRRGRLLRQVGKLDGAIAAYQRAVDHIEAIRQDIPVEYQDGRSSFRDTLEPVYLGLTDLLLQQSGSLNGKEHAAQLRRARNTLELLKQTELEDFLGDRCSVESIRKTSNDPVQRGTAVLYPIILPERLELLVETSAGLQRVTVPVAASDVRNDVARFASALRAAQSFQNLSRKLYDRLLKPVDAILEQEKVDTVVVVPDGVLRLLPYAALNDGKRFAIQKYAIAIAPGLTMTNTQVRTDPNRQLKTLLAGMSEPGAVVEKLPEAMVKQLLSSSPSSSQSSTRGILMRGGLEKPATTTGTNASQTATTPKPADPVLNQEARNEKLKQILSLAGVKDEIETISKIAPGETLLNQGFSLNAFGQQVTRGDYRIVHIASHGLFGGTADTTFIMAHDDLITIDKLQNFLRSAGQHDGQIELLTLSACETAEGDDRAPLGLSGAALKARAKTALGSLWPVADDAAKALMAEFYKNMQLPGVSKAKALQAAQLKLIANRSLAHPFFWAPFIVVGSWL